VETLGHLGKPAMGMLRQLVGMAARYGNGAFTQVDVMLGVLTKIGCGLCRYNQGSSSCLQAVACYFALGVSKSFTGLLQPDVELASERRGTCVLEC
jgi:hypothetical protein